MSLKCASRINQISTVEKELFVTVPANLVKKSVDKAYVQIAKEARLPGFRPGKAPRALLEQKFSVSAARHALEDVISVSLREVLAENKIISVSQPSITRTDDFAAGKDFSYDVKVECVPEISLADYDGLKLNVTKFSFDDTDVEKELASVQKMFAPYVQVEGRDSIQDGDFVEGSFIAAFEGVEIAGMSHQESGLISLNEGEIFPELRVELLTKSVPCDFSVEVLISNDFQDENLRGKIATVTGSAKAIKELKLPTLDDEFARDVSSQFQDLAALKEFITKRLEGEKQQREKDSLFNSVADALLKDNPLEVPPSMIAEQAREIAAQSLGQFGKQEADEFWRMNGEKLFEACKERAKRGLQVLMLSQAIADKENIQLTNEELSEGINKEISRRHLKQAEISKLFNREGVQLFGQQMRADKALELVASRAIITTEMHALHNG